ncbi:MAG: hypothetical protein J7647_20215 [Cyanobacteria bacterium SBLK]|nr:hypothetical protein [Cyanobacteria bacterium SBLK]
MNLSIRLCLITIQLIVFSFCLYLTSPWEKKALANPNFSQVYEIERIYEEWLEKTKIYLITDTWQLKVDSIELYECKDLEDEKKALCERDGTSYFYKIDLQLHQSPQERDGLRFWDDYNQQFYNIYGIELDDKLLLEASHLLGVPGYKVDIEIHTEYSSRIITMNSEYKIHSVLRRQSHHQEAQVSIPLDSLPSNLTTRVNSTRIQTNVDSTQQKIIDFLKNRYNFRKNYENWQWIKNDKDYISFSISGLKNEVFQRNNRWEKLKITIFLDEVDDELELTLIVSGYIAPGLGYPPPTRAYLGMEPRYSGELQSYTNNLITQLQESLTD